MHFVILVKMREGEGEPYSQSYSEMFQVCEMSRLLPLPRPRPRAHARGVLDAECCLSQSHPLFIAAAVGPGRGRVGLLKVAR